MSRWTQKGDEVWQHGVDFGNGSKPLTVWARQGNTIMIKVPPGKHWASLLDGYVSHPGYYLIGTVSDEERDGDGHCSSFHFTKLLEAPLSNRGRTS